jgi:hypothetical protein
MQAWLSKNKFLYFNYASRTTLHSIRIAKKFLWRALHIDQDTTEIPAVSAQDCLAAKMDTATSKHTKFESDTLQEDASGFYNKKVCLHGILFKKVPLDTVISR